MDNVNMPITDGATLTDRIKVFLAAHNQRVAEADAEERLEFPDGEFTPTPVATMADVVKCISAGHVPDAFGLTNLFFDSPMRHVMGEVMRTIAGMDYEPWPELTKEELRFLIGDRLDSNQCPYELYRALTFNVDMPLTFGERVSADRHRVWLEKGADAKRKRLKKAKAEVSKLTGKAA